MSIVSSSSVVITSRRNDYGVQKLKKFTKQLRLSKLFSLKGFLGFVPLSVGVSVLTFYYWVTAICSILVNMLLYNPMMSFGFLSVHIFNIWIMITWVFAGLGLFLEKSSHLKRAMIMWAIFVFSWIFVVTCTFYKYGVILICMECRCPDSFWMFNNIWFNITDPKPQFRPPSPNDNIMDRLFDNNEVEVLPEWRSVPSFLTRIMNLAVEDVEVVTGQYSGSLKNELLKMENKINKDVLKNSMDLIIQNANEKNRNILITELRMHFIILLIIIFINGAHMIHSLIILFSYFRELQCLEECNCNGGQLNESQSDNSVRKIVCR